MKKGEKIEFSGERFKSYLSSNGITYKEASEDLGIDKNTVGKLVRGGNMNVSVILRACNVYQLPIHSFFKIVNETFQTAAYLDEKESLYQIGDLQTVAEMQEEYGFNERKVDELLRIITAKDKEISLLRELLINYRERLSSK